MKVRSLSSSVNSHPSRALRASWFILFSDLISYFVQQHFQTVCTFVIIIILWKPPSCCYLCSQWLLLKWLEPNPHCASLGQPFPWVPSGGWHMVDPHSGLQPVSSGASPTPPVQSPWLCPSLALSHCHPLLFSAIYRFISGLPFWLF